MAFLIRLFLFFYLTFFSLLLLSIFISYFLPFLLSLLILLFAVLFLLSFHSSLPFLCPCSLSLPHYNLPTSHSLIIHSLIHPFIYQWLHSHLLGHGLFFSFVIFFYTVGWTPWTSDQSVARPLSTHRTTQTQNKCTHKHPCLVWDSNPQSQHPSERRRFLP
jgi:hypothetical protein